MEDRMPKLASHLSRSKYCGPWATICGRKLISKHIRSIARYTVESISLHVEPEQSEREIKVAGERTTYQHLIDDLGAVQGKTYQCTYLSREEALIKQEESRKSRDEASEMIWSLKSLIASGSAVVPGKLDNDKFSFVPETAKETFQRIFPVA